MKVLLVGDDAVSHAVAEQIAKSAELYSLMKKSNPGIKALSIKSFITDMTNAEAIGLWAITEEIDIAFVSSSYSLAAGVVDALLKAGVPVASSTKAAAKVEWDKSYLRKIMEKYSIPGRPRYYVARTSATLERAVREFGSYAVKPLGISGGKDVILRKKGDEKTALQTARKLMRRDKGVIIEELLEGEEFCLQAFTDGKRVSIAPPVQSFRRAYAGDKGPVVGGVGSYLAGDILPFLGKKDVEEAKTILEKIIRAMRMEGTPLMGVVSAKFMATAEGVRIVDMNVGFDDPGGIAVLPLLKTEFVEILLSIIDGNLKIPAYRSYSTIVKYALAKGYPKKNRKVKFKIDHRCLWNLGLKLYSNNMEEKNGFYFGSSRVFALFSKATTLEEAYNYIEEGFSCVKGDLHHRKDIASPEEIRRKTTWMEVVRE